MCVEQKEPQRSHSQRKHSDTGQEQTYFSWMWFATIRTIKEWDYCKGKGIYCIYMYIYKEIGMIS